MEGGGTLKKLVKTALGSFMVSFYRGMMGRLSWECMRFWLFLWFKVLSVKLSAIFKVFISSLVIVLANWEQKELHNRVQIHSPGILSHFKVVLANRQRATLADIWSSISVHLHVSLFLAFGLHQPLKKTSGSLAALVILVYQLVTNLLLLPFSGVGL